MKKYYFLFAIAVFSLLNINAQTRLSQSIDPLTINLVGEACNDESSMPQGYFLNSFYRAYKLADFGITNDFQISSLEYGQGDANDGIVVNLNIYTVDTDDLSTATFTFQGSTTHVSSSADDLSLINKPLSLTIPSGSIIAFEISIGANTSSNAASDFLSGYNNSGENDDTYWEASNCGYNTPTTWTQVGLSSQQYVMNIVGNEVLSVEDNKLFEFSLSPNPTSDIIHIKTDASNAIKELKLYDVLGKMVLKSTNTKILNISRLKTGLYILELSTNQGKAVKRVIKN